MLAVYTRPRDGDCPLVCLDETHPSPTNRLLPVDPATGIVVAEVTD